MAVNLSAARAAIPFIELRQLTLRLASSRILFERVSHCFGPGLTGIVGANGSGKSMLARIIAGLAVPDAGGVAMSGRIQYVPQQLSAALPRAACGAGTVAELAGLGPLLAANVRMDAGEATDGDFELLDGRWTVLADFAMSLQSCGLTWLSPGDRTTNLSGGELTRVALAGAFASGADWLLLDEPSNHLDRTGRDWLLRQLRDWPGNAIIISHDRDLLEAMDIIVELDASGLQTYGGNYTHYRAQRDLQQDAAEATLVHARTERRTALREQAVRHNALQSRAARNNRAGKEANMPAIVRGKRKSNAQASAGRESLLRAETRSELDAAVRTASARVRPAAAITLLMPGTAVPGGRRVLTLEGAIAAWPSAHSLGCGNGEAPLDLVLTGPVRLAITGPNGCGKTTLLRMLAGQIMPRGGTVRALVPFALLDQHASTLQAAQSVLEALRELDSPLAEGTLRSHLSLLGLGAAQVTAPIAALSGGERIKAALACALWRKDPAQLLLLDEPTNHLDLPSIEALEQALANFPGAMAVVSHDRRFLDALQASHELAWSPQGWQLTER